MELDPALLDSLIEAANNKTNVSGYTHDFYNYPARFPPLFVREIINTFTKEGDLILDPFMGGGTTLIESKMLKRHSIGFDISTLAYFISKVKTRVLTTSQIIEINSWAHNVVPFLKCNMDYERPTEWIEAGYHRNLCDRPTWPIKILMEKYLSEVVKMRNARTRDFLRAALLKSGQWALDSKKIIPTAEEFRIRLVDNIFSMLQTIPSISQTGKIRTICQNKPAHE